MATKDGWAAMLLALALVTGCRPSGNVDSAAPSPPKPLAETVAAPIRPPSPGLPLAPSKPPELSVAKDCPIRLREVTAECGVVFEHRDGSSGKHYTPETMSAGVAAFDYDGDGLIDLYFPNGAALLGAQYDPPPRHALYKNLGGWKFRDVSRAAGIDCGAFGLGIAAADYDNDGDQDIYLNNFGPNIFYRNNGDGTFTDVTAAVGAAGDLPGSTLAKKVGAGACFLDVDGDGRLDLYAANYIEIDLPTYVVPMKGKWAFYPSPMVYDPVPSVLYRNEGGGRLADVSKASGIGAIRGRGMGATAVDYDNDGDADLFVCNDVFENFLLRNDGRGKFEQAGFLAGIAVGANGDMLANMAVDAGDFNNDGWMDFFTTNYDKQYKMLLRNGGDGVYTDVGRESGAGTTCYPFVNWGCAMVDLDNDGRKDLFVCNGHTDDNVGHVDSTTSYRCHNAAYWNLGNEKFVDASERADLKALPLHAARGVAFDDLDNDGDLDAAILNSRERATVLRNELNEGGSKNHWLQIRLRGVKSNRDGVGARVKVVAGDLVQIDEVHSGRGYQSHWGTRLHFGLGPRAKVDRVEVRWCGGGSEVWENLAVDRLTVLVEGQGRPR